MKIIEFTAAFFTILGFYLVSESIVFGFVVSMLGNTLWIYWGAQYNARFLIILNSVLYLIAFKGAIL